MPTHHETRKLPYSAQQMFDLVADVERYPEFLPWIAATRVTERRDIPGGEEMVADLVVSFKVFREKFASRVTLRHEEMKIDTSYLEGPFKHMESTWGFRDLEQGCEVTFDVDFEFRNRILGRAAGVFFNEAMQRIVRAFERRADALYGGKGSAG